MDKNMKNTYNRKFNYNTRIKYSNWKLINRNTFRNYNYQTYNEKSYKSRSGLHWKYKNSRKMYYLSTKTYDYSDKYYWSNNGGVPYLNNRHVHNRSRGYYYNVGRSYWSMFNNGENNTISKNSRVRGAYDRNDRSYWGNNCKYDSQRSGIGTYGSTRQINEAKYNWRRETYDSTIKDYIKKSSDYNDVDDQKMRYVSTETSSNHSVQHTHPSSDNGSLCNESTRVGDTDTYDSPKSEDTNIALRTEKDDETLKHLYRRYIIDLRNIRTQKEGELKIVEDHLKHKIKQIKLKLKRNGSNMDNF